MEYSRFTEKSWCAVLHLRKNILIKCAESNSCWKQEKWKINNYTRNKGVFSRFSVKIDECYIHYRIFTTYLYRGGILTTFLETAAALHRRVYIPQGLELFKLLMMMILFLKHLMVKSLMKSQKRSSMTWTTWPSFTLANISVVNRFVEDKIENHKSEVNYNPDKLDILFNNAFMVRLLF